ncbi:MAG: hypothetical protein E7521_08580 [Ruminococcaceae bacterium]|nr:hypothetical protein [Oscillospiraceae bacterium]
MKKIKNFFKQAFAKVKKSADKIVMMAAFPLVPMTAETTTTPVDVSGLVESIKGFFSDFTVSNLVIIIGAALALSVVLFLFWFAYRFIKRAVVKALKRGTI